MKIAFIGIGIFIGLILLIGLILYLVGATQPERHTASITFTLPKPRAAVWDAFVDYAAMPQWWPAVKKIRFETRSDGKIITWNTDANGREIGFGSTEEIKPARLVREIVGENLPFGGTWTYDLVEEASSTRVTLTEDGFIKPPLFRGIAKFFLKPDATMRDFEKHFKIYMAK